MDGIPRENHDAGQIAGPTELGSPHFDKIAVAAAQPVRPLPWHARLNSFAASRQPIAIVIAFGFILLTVAVVAFFLLARSEQAKANEPDASLEGTSQTIEPPQTQTAPVAPAQPEAAVNSAVITTDKFAWRSRTTVHRVRPVNRRVPVIVEDQGKPVARKVGEIRYGSSDRP
jgi:hypothetical protein